MSPLGDKVVEEAIERRSSFTQSEVDELRRLIREKQTADRDRQKSLRTRMRKIGFYITDYADYSGFTVSDFDDLVTRGVVTVKNSTEGD
jgi:hypothetical protein